MQTEIIFVVCILLLSCVTLSLARPRRLRNSQLRISEKKCEEYKQVYQEIFDSPLPPPFASVEYGDLKCPSVRLPTIVGGRNAQPDEYPHMAALGYENPDYNPRSESSSKFNFYCGGTLISEEYVLTAAHCIEYPRIVPKIVMLGDIHLSASVYSSRREVPIARVIRHPNYKPPSSYNDIALLHLARNVSIEPRNRRAPRPSIRPACLPNSDLALPPIVAATGWGGNGTEYQTETLQAVQFTVVTNDLCQEHYDESSDYQIRFPNDLQATQFCAGQEGKDTCQGDSGGPVVISRDINLTCMHTIVGITSLGTKACGQGTPAIYTNVVRYLDWIESHVWSKA